MQTSSYHLPATQTFVSVILPLATPKPYTYHVPEELIPEIKFGVRVEVQFGKQKRYTGLVIEVHDVAPEGHRTKPIVAIVDEQPLINRKQLALWRWLADYYCCTLGEVMHAALPANLKLTSETLLTLSPLYDGDFLQLDDQEYLIAEALTIQDELSIEDVRGILGIKTVYPLVRRMIEKRIIYLKENIRTKYKPKSISCIRLLDPYASDRSTMNEAFDKLSRSQRQAEALLAYIQLEKKQEYIRCQDIYKLAKVDSSVLRAMEKKGIFERYEREVSRLGGYEEDTVGAAELSEQQIQALASIKSQYEDKQVILLHGVTGSGKTRVYVELIREMLANGKQVLYLLPEIALTTQITDRLQQVLGDDIAVYHSRMSNNERVELWNAVTRRKLVVLGARSALFLPFDDLGLIIVDEEHDRSYKQHDPSPRYNGRDAAIVLAQYHNAKVLLGTATPSIETYHNVRMKKYGLVEMPKRFGGLQMPEINIVDAKKEQQQRKLQSHFSSVLIAELKAALERGEQAILFQNRRGFSPTYRCATCGWHSECIHCDVSLTYHKYFNQLKCHYCGYQTALPRQCPACGSTHLILQGFGTEKIEDELKIYLPEAKISRMDFDTVRSKYAHAQIINDFEERRIDILVGTQMVTKGLDFENVGVVGVLSADQLLQFPDFRASERAFQLMVQVSGRAGRKHKQGKVIIQAFNMGSPVLREVFHHDFASFIKREIRERQDFLYPPFVRLIRITLKHKKPELLNEAAKLYGQLLKRQLGNWVIGPAVPYISRVRNYYLLDFMVKLEKDAAKIRFAKETVLNSTDEMQHTEGYSGVRVNIDVDPF